MVHSTLDDVLNPGTTSMQSTDQVYAWVTGTLQVRGSPELCRCVGHLNSSGAWVRCVGQVLFR